MMLLIGARFISINQPAIFNSIDRSFSMRKTIAVNPSSEQSRLQGVLSDTFSKHAGVNPNFPHVTKYLYENIHGFMVSKDGHVLAEGSHEGMNKNNTTPSETYLKEDLVLFNSSTPHSVRSVSKTITAMLIGVMLKKYPTITLESSLNTLLPEKYRLPHNETLTLKDVLSMKTGWKWNEMGPYIRGENDEVDMNAALDPIEYVLSRPRIEKQGHVYCGGTTAVLATIIKYVTSQDPAAFLYEHLLKPLGIEESSQQCNRYLTGYDLPNFASGMQLTLLAMDKLGVVLLNKGKWGETELISPDYVAQLLSEQVKTSTFGFSGYGFQTWIDHQLFLDATGKEKTLTIFHASGNGGQKIMMIPELNICCTVIAGNYNLPNRMFPCSPDIKKGSATFFYTEVLREVCGLRYIPKLPSKL